MHPVDGSQPEPYPARTDIEFSYMIKTQQATLFLQQLEQQYPRIFKRNFLLYGQIKAKGMLDDYKEFIPWGLAVMIFVSTAFALNELISMTFPQFEGVQSFGSSDMDYYNLQQVRRACLWSYKQTLKARAAMKFIPKDSDKFSIAEQHLAEFLELHLKLIKYENELSRTNKFTDLDEYVDSLM